MCRNLTTWVKHSRGYRDLHRIYFRIRVPNKLGLFTEKCPKEECRNRAKYTILLYLPLLRDIPCLLGTFLRTPHFYWELLSVTRSYIDPNTIRYTLSRW